MNWINSWSKGNKKGKYNIEIRFGRITILEIKLCLCSEGECSRFRITALNFGIEF